MPVPLHSLLEASPYLSELHLRHGEWLETALQAPDAALSTLLASLAKVSADAGTDESAVGLALRQAKGQVALLAAAAETSGDWSTAQSTAALSDLADAALEAGLAVLLARAVAKGDLRATTTAECGLAIFALGKHGGRELNYSSDIDIVAFFDPQLGVVVDEGESTKIYARIVQRLAALMQDRVGNDYVFRTDLRLRPDPGSTPLALSIDAALAYYESRGQNWERAAWIKARPCAGDKRVGEGFLAELAPYVWRKHLDFATIADIQAMKRQINISRNVGEARVEGHNVKLGRGGIREIEFFAQTQQLIAGGRDKALRVRPTTEALAALAAAGWIAQATATALTNTYWFLRAVENRLQMLRDEQTHVMPDTGAGVAIIATLMDFPDLASFEAEYRAALSVVQGYYAELFTEGETLGAAGGNLVFTGSDDDPATLETLSGMGFKQPAIVSATVRKWHYGGYAATRAAAARAHLTELLPALLTTISKAGNADLSFQRFDDFLSRLPSGVQLFALLRNHAELRELLVQFMASAPRMADAVIHRAHVMDPLIDPAFADNVARRKVLVDKVGSFLGDARDYQEVIDRARIIGQEQQFLIAAGLLSGTLTSRQAGEQFTALAETLLLRLLGSVRREFEARHGVIRGATLALLAFGKMASKEMTASSDLDFILLYDAPPGSEESSGPKPLATSQYFARLTQRLVAAITSPTSEGVLYKADMRLRPSGNAGPLATSLGAFRIYQAESAWTWEHLALTRARVVADGGLAQRIDAAIAEELSRPRDAGKVVDEVLEMRALIAKERAPRHAFDLKLVSGGLVDLEFIAQSAQLLARKAIGRPQAPTSQVLTRLAEVGLVPEGARLALIHGVYSTVLQVMSAALSDPFRDDGWTDAFRDLVAGLANAPSFSRLVEDLDVMQSEARETAERWYERARSL